jgi:hypothetical protein
MGDASMVPSDAQIVSSAEQPLLDFPKPPDNAFLRSLEKDCREKKENWKLRFHSRNLSFRPVFSNQIP